MRKDSKTGILKKKNPTDIISHITETKGRENKGTHASVRELRMTRMYT
jgi:hypothetical protein